MARIGKKDIEIMIRNLTVGDDYEKAIEHFLSVANQGGVIDQSTKIPREMRSLVQSMYSGSIEKINKFFRLDEKTGIDRLRLYYIEKYNFVHGVFLNRELHVVSIYFPSLDKGAFAVYHVTEGRQHFFRFTAFREHKGEA